MHFHNILVKMVVINEISAQNNPHTVKFSTQNALEGHKIGFGVHFCIPHIQVDFSPYYKSPYILFPFQCRSILNPHFNWHLRWEKTQRMGLVEIFEIINYS